MTALLKPKPCHSQALRDSARGERCTVEEPHRCIDGNGETTVLAHIPDETGTGKMGGKSPDLFAVYACYGCHSWIDSREPDRWRDWRIHRAHKRTLRRWYERGLISVKGAK